jgi:glycosyltransferase involved in cell wall biosynthesis
LKISIVIPMYNAKNYIVETLESVVRQTYPIHEILVIDDCSTDGSNTVVEEFSAACKQIRLIRQASNQGVSAARNRGLQESESDWILLLDADDILESKLVEKEVQLLLDELPRTLNVISAIHPAYIQIDSDSQLVASSEMRGVQYSLQNLFGSLLVRNHIITPSGMLINKEVANSIGGFRTDLKLCEDFDFYLRIAKVGIILYLDEVLVRYRRHLGNVTDRAGTALSAGSRIVNAYSTQEIEKAILGRTFSTIQNKQDLVKVLYYIDRYEHGYEALKTIDTNENRTTTLFLSSLYDIRFGKIERAHETLNELVRLDASQLAARNNLGVVLTRLGKLDEAQKVFYECLMDSPSYLDAANNLKVLSNNQGDASYKFTLRELRANLLRYASL